MNTLIDIEIKLKEIKPFLVEKFNVKQIGYFGSFAKNQQTEGSDIDILVEFSKTPGWDFFTLEEYLEKIFNRKIDLVTKQGIKKQLRNTILRSVKYID
jgi:uncharacterized protein